MKNFVTWPQTSFWCTATKNICPSDQRQFHISFVFLGTWKHLLLIRWRKKYFYIYIIIYSLYEEFSLQSYIKSTSIFNIEYSNCCPNMLFQSTPHLDISMSFAAVMFCKDGTWNLRGLEHVNQAIRIIIFCITIS